MNAPVLSAFRLVTHRTAPLGPTNDRILALGAYGERILRCIRPDTKTFALEGDRLAGFDLGDEEGREAFVDALGLAVGTADAVRAVLAWTPAHRARIAELVIAWSTSEPVPSRLVVSASFADVLALAKAMPEAGRQIEDLYIVGRGSAIHARDIETILEAFPNLKTLWTTEGNGATHLRIWDMATRGRRASLAPPPWIRAQGVACWSKLRGFLS